MEKDGQRVTVVWNTNRRPLTAVVTAAASQAIVFDAVGRSSPLQAQDGVYRLYLSAGRDNTEPRDNNLVLVGGRPQIIVEQVGPGTRASTPPQVEEGAKFANGFSIANAQFLEYFNLRGGEKTFGLPISREFELRGVLTQVFQRQVMQLSSDGSVQTLNLLDPELMPYTRFNGSVLPGADPGMKSATPNPTDRDYADKIVRFIREQVVDTWQNRPVGFGSAFSSSVTCRDAFPAGGCQENLLPLYNLDVWGAPTSPPTVDP